MTVCRIVLPEFFRPPGDSQVPWVTVVASTIVCLALLVASLLRPWSGFHAAVALAAVPLATLVAGVGDARLRRTRLRRHVDAQFRLQLECCRAEVDAVIHTTRDALWMRAPTVSRLSTRGEGKVISGGARGAGLERETTPQPIPRPELETLGVDGGEGVGTEKQSSFLLTLGAGSIASQVEVVGRSSSSGAYAAILAAARQIDDAPITVGLPCEVVLSGPRALTRAAARGLVLQAFLRGAVVRFSVGDADSGEIPLRLRAGGDGMRAEWLWAEVVTEQLGHGLPQTDSPASPHLAVRIDSAQPHQTVSALGSRASESPRSELDADAIVISIRAASSVGDLVSHRRLIDIQHDASARLRRSPERSVTQGQDDAALIIAAQHSAEGQVPGEKIEVDFVSERDASGLCGRLVRNRLDDAFIGAAPPSDGAVSLSVDRRAPVSVEREAPLPVEHQISSERTLTFPPGQCTALITEDPQGRRSQLTALPAAISVRSLAGHASEGTGSQSPSELAHAAAEMLPHELFVGSVDEWTANWALLALLRPRHPLLFDGCSGAVIRALARCDDIPPPCDPHKSEVVVFRAGHGFSRARLPGSAQAARATSGDTVSRASAAPTAELVR